MKVRTIAKRDLATIAGESWVNPHRAAYIDGETAYIPVQEGLFYDCEIPERKRHCGRGFFMAGDVAIIHGRRPSYDEIEEIIRLRHPRGIIWIRSVDYPTRIPDTEIMFGDAGEVCHREDGYVYTFDPRAVMFAQGNIGEKRRMAWLIKNAKKCECVADMFAGIGYFTIPMAGAGAFVHAMEINPVAFRYLQHNIVQNRLARNVRAECGDCRDLLSGIYDRIVMGHFDAVSMLAGALMHVRSGSVIHMHSLGFVKEKIQSLVTGAGFSAEIHVHKVKKYRPHTWHVVQDVVIQ